MTPAATGVPAVDVLIVWGSAAVAVAGLAGLAWRVLRGVQRLVRRVDQFIDDWGGTEERPGVPARLGVMARLDRIEHELHPNDGGSLRDALDRVDRRMARLFPDEE